VQGEGEGDPPGTTSAWMSVAAMAEVGAAAQGGAGFLRTFLVVEFLLGRRPLTRVFANRWLLGVLALDCTTSYFLFVVAF